MFLPIGEPDHFASQDLRVENRLTLYILSKTDGRFLAFNYEMVLPFLIELNDIRTSGRSIRKTNTLLKRQAAVRPTAVTQEKSEDCLPNEFFGCRNHITVAYEAFNEPKPSV